MLEPVALVRKLTRPVARAGGGGVEFRAETLQSLLIRYRDVFCRFQSACKCHLACIVACTDLEAQQANFVLFAVLADPRPGVRGGQLLPPLGTTPLFTPPIPSIQGRGGATFASHLGWSRWFCGVSRW